MSSDNEHLENAPTYFRDSLLRRVFLNTVLAFHLWRMRRKLNQKLTTLENTIRTFEKERARSIRLGMPNYLAVHDATLFLVLFSYDLTVLQADCLSELRLSRKNLYARQLSLLIYEGLDDLVVVLGKPLRSAVESFTNEQEVLQRLGECTKQLNALRKKHEAELSEIRQVVAAHREHRPDLQLQVMQKMDPRRIDALARDVDLTLHAIVLCLTDVARLMRQPRVMLRNICSAKGQR